MRKVLLNEKVADEVMRILNDEGGTLSLDMECIADAFGVLSNLINKMLYSDDDWQKRVGCCLYVMEVLNKYNSLLIMLSDKTDRTDGCDNDCPHCQTRQSNKVDADPLSQSLGGIVKLWLSCHDSVKSIEILERLEETTDGDTQELLHDVVSILKQFDNEIERR